MRHYICNIIMEMSDVSYLIYSLTIAKREAIEKFSIYSGQI